MSTLLLLAFLAAFGQEQAPKPTPTPTPTPDAPLTEIPKDAQRLEPELYKWVDSHGKAWLLRRTPFGIIRTPEVPANLAFGGPDLRTLFLTARTSVYSLRVKVPGQPHPLFRAKR